MFLGRVATSKSGFPPSLKSSRHQVISSSNRGDDHREVRPRISCSFKVIHGACAACAVSFVPFEVFYD
ncbi:hypothetical protein RRG08_043671 [Elysia crispata]|uniref:Uncharacterized protein n=1 Tax=Elysia crispata TaxID=231223 RepID=A0AAE0ZVW3_9GAST|nr:hypothetical protein RRG08_043671 [Elysia crispata]